MIFVLDASAVVPIAILDPIANVEHCVESCALFTLKFHGLAMHAAEVLDGREEIFGYAYACNK